MTAIPVQITMDDDDFSHLCNNSMRWADGPTWSVHIRNGRFEVYGDGELTQPSLHWKFAHWAGTDYAAVILAKSFLSARGFECEIAWDQADPGEWMILTDYDYILQRRTVGTQQ